MFKYNFEDLNIWKLALSVIKEVKKITSKFPKEELYILKDQMRRASVSVALNIAEGSGRGSKRDFKRFIRNAIGSTLEVIGGLRIAINEKYIISKEAEKLDNLLKELYFKLIGFEKYLGK